MPSFDPNKPATVNNALLDIDQIRTNTIELRHFEESNTQPANLVNGLIWKTSTAPSGNDRYGVAIVASAYYMYCTASPAGWGFLWKQSDEIIAIPTNASQWGDIIYKGTSGWARKAAGTAGYVLKTNGANADPAWIDPATLASAISSSLVWTASTQGSVTIPTGGSTWVPPAGLYTIYLTHGGGAGAPTYFELRYDTVWYPDSGLFSVGTVYSDGTNMRFRNTSGSQSSYAYYIKHGV